MPIPASGVLQHPMRTRVLIVDDIQINLDVLVGMLRQEHDCVTAISGHKALEVLQAGPLPDLVLLDVMMPGMSGYEVHAAIRDTPAWRAIPVIYVTARNDPQSESEALGNGAVDFIHKPVNKDVLRARVAAFEALVKASTNRNELGWLNQGLAEARKSLQQ